MNQKEWVEIFKEINGRNPSPQEFEAGKTAGEFVIIEENDIHIASPENVTVGKPKRKKKRRWLMIPVVIFLLLIGIGIADEVFKGSSVSFVNSLITDTSDNGGVYYNVPATGYYQVLNFQDDNNLKVEYQAFNYTEDKLESKTDYEGEYLKDFNELISYLEKSNVSEERRNKLKDRFEQSPFESMEITAIFNIEFDSDVITFNFIADSVQYNYFVDERFQEDSDTFKTLAIHEKFIDKKINGAWKPTAAYYDDGSQRDLKDFSVLEFENGVWYDTQDISHYYVFIPYEKIQQLVEVEIVANSSSDKIKDTDEINSILIKEGYKISDYSNVYATNSGAIWVFVDGGKKILAMNSVTDDNAYSVFEKIELKE
ncbi:hypothetical protein K6V43_04490 [Streptococcus suis]|nr:hypothetical protein [Streptococcus suis]